MSPEGLAASAVAWLCGDRRDRARHADMRARFGSAPLFGVTIGGTTVLAAFTYGWWLVLLVVLAAVTVVAAQKLSPMVTRPEFVGAAMFVLLEVNVAASVLLTGGAQSPLLPLMVVPVFTLAVCFRPVVARTSVGLSALFAVAAVVGADQLPEPPSAPAWLHLVAYLGLVCALALAAHYLASADISARADAVIDPLTGLFNRRALLAHFPEASVQAGIGGGGLAVVVCDLDRFKLINDTAGHDQGDLVLQGFARRLRAAVRTSDLVYRTGGEEFLVLLPGHDPHAASEVAERLCLDVAADPIAGIAVTVSVGVANARGSAIDLARMTKDADLALYRAKREGGNVVRLAQ